MTQRIVRVTTSIGAEFVRHPSWAFERARAVVEKRRDRTSVVPFEMAVPVDELDAAGIGMDALELKDALKEARAVVNEGTQSGKTTVPREFDATLTLARLIFAVTRILRPQRVVEVGVGRGATTRAILLALHANDVGMLESIEFPLLRPRYAESVGQLVPKHLRGQWSIQFGPSRKLLPRLLQGRPVDLFLHDGSHTYHGQRSDLLIAAGGMSRRALIVVDDVGNEALSEVAAMSQASVQYIRQPPKRAPIGLARRV